MIDHDLSTIESDAGLLLGPEVTVAQRQRLRITYAKGEAVKFISHHDEFRLWERALRRADLPLLYKQGFNPQPHMQFASPLGVGFTGAREWVDILLCPPLPPDEVAARLRACLPPGVAVLDVAEISLKAPALQGLLFGADYTILLYAAPGEVADGHLESRIADFLARGEIWRERERKGERYTYNLRPLVFELRYAGYDAASEEHRIFLRVQQRAGATGRPDEVVDALGLDDFARTLRRERLYCVDNEEDLAVFAQYPEVTQADVAGPRPARGSARGCRYDLAPRCAGGRSFHQRTRGRRVRVEPCFALGNLTDLTQRRKRRKERHGLLFRRECIPSLRLRVSVSLRQVIQFCCDEVNIRTAALADLPAWLRLRQALGAGGCPPPGNGRLPDSPALLVVVAEAAPGVLVGFLEARSAPTPTAAKPTTSATSRAGTWTPPSATRASAHLCRRRRVGWPRLHRDGLRLPAGKPVSLAAHLALGYTEVERLIHFAKRL